LGAIVGGSIGGAVLTWFAPKRLFIYNEEWSAYVSQDMWLGTMVPYGPGLSVSFPWEQRNKTGNYSLRPHPEVLMIPVQTKTSKVTVKVTLEYMFDLSNLGQAIGADAEAIKTDYASFIGSFLTQKLSDMDAETARKSVRSLNDMLAEEFMGVEDAKGMTPAEFEGQFGIITVSITIGELSLPEDVERTRNAIDEAEELFKVTAALYGKSPEKLATDLESGTITHEQFEKMTNRAMATSKNANMNINVVEVNIPELVGKMIARFAK